MPLKGIKSVTDLQQCLQFYMYRACVNEPMRSRPYPVYINMRTKAGKQTKRKIIQVACAVHNSACAQKTEPISLDLFSVIETKYGPVS